MLDPAARGQVQILPTGDAPFSQAQAAIAELKRLSSLDDGWDWSSCAVRKAQFFSFAAIVAAFTLLALLASCSDSSREQGEALPERESNASIKKEGEALQERTVTRHRALIAKRVQYSHSLVGVNRIDAYQAEYDAVMNHPIILPEEGERGVLLFWLNTYYEAAKVIDAHAPDINHYCR